MTLLFQFIPLGGFVPCRSQTSNSPLPQASWRDAGISFTADSITTAIEVIHEQEQFARRAALGRALGDSSQASGGR